LSDLVLDASVALAWIFPDENDAYADAVMLYLAGRSGIVPAIWFFEVANAAVVAERRGRIREPLLSQALELIATVSVEVDQSLVHPASIAAIVSLARRTRLSAYDAAYLELAKRLRLPLATTDSRMRRAAINAEVEAFTPPS
jgi:predicted nucleic acid-binding protein